MMRKISYQLLLSLAYSYLSFLILTYSFLFLLILTKHIFFLIRGNDEEISAMMGGALLLSLFPLATSLPTQPANCELHYHYCYKYGNKDVWGRGFPPPTFENSCIELCARCL